MTTDAVEALRSDVRTTTDLIGTFDEATWSAPSACEGWSVKDLVAHLASGFASLVDPGSTPPPQEGEPFTEPAVRAWREEPAADVAEHYRTVSGPGLEALAGIQQPPQAETRIPIATLGTYPLHLVANALAFDHWCHLREDLAGPRGPLSTDFPANDPAVAATVEWLLAGLPQMCADTLNPLVTRPVVLELDGPGGGAYTMVPADGDLTVAEGAADGAAGTVSSTCEAFVRWSTRRTDWRDETRISGDEDYLATVLDAVDLE